MYQYPDIPAEEDPTKARARWMMRRWEYAKEDIYPTYTKEDMKQEGAMKKTKLIIDNQSDLLINEVLQMVWNCSIQSSNFNRVDFQTGGEWRADNGYSLLIIPFDDSIKLICQKSIQGGE